jgi:protein ImuA
MMNIYDLRAAVVSSRTAPDSRLAMGVPAIDAALPWGGLPAGLHEITAPLGDGAGVGLAVALMRRRKGAILWCRPRGTDGEAGAPYGPGLRALGLAPERLIIAEAAKPVGVLWAMEEGLRAKHLAGVLGEGIKADLTASRRLQLAAEAGNGAAFLVTTASSREPAASLSAITRWRVRSLPSLAEAGGPGRPRWALELWRCRGGGRPQSWMVEWNDAALSLDLVPDLVDRPLAAAAG